MTSHPGPGRTSRRTLLRVAGHSAWTAPVVAAAAAAPAYAAASDTGPITITSAQFYVRASADQYLLIPHLTLTNTSATPTRSLSMVVQFPVVDFTGTITSTQPPMPQIGNLALFQGQGWLVQWEEPDPGDTVVYIDVTRVAGPLAPGAACEFGLLAAVSSPCFVVADDPTAQHLPFSLSATFANSRWSVAGSMLKVAKPVVPGGPF